MRAKTALPSDASRLEVGIQEGLQLRFGDGTLMPRHHLTIAEQDQRGNALHLISITGLRVGINFDLANAQAIAIVTRDPIHQGGDQSTGTTPGSPEINKDRAGSLQHVTFKTGIGEIGNSSSQGFQITEPILWKTG